MEFKDFDFDEEKAKLVTPGIKSIVAIFGIILGLDARQAQVTLVSSVATCLAMFPPDERVAVIRALFELIKDIGVESFEDGYDFASLLKERAEERRQSKE